MTVSSTNRKAGPFLGDDVAIRFPFVFKVFSKEDVRAVHADVLGVESDLILDRDFAVTLNPDQENTPGGEIVLPNPLPTGETLTLTSKVQALQKVKITNAGGFYPSVQNTVFDKLTVLVQQLAEQVSRSVKVKISSDTNPDDLVADLQHKATLAVQAQTRADEAAQAAQSNAELIILNVQTALDAKEEVVRLREKAQESQVGASGFALRAEAAQGQAKFYTEQSVQLQGRVERDATQVTETANVMAQVAQQAAQSANTAREAKNSVQAMVHEANQLSRLVSESAHTVQLRAEESISNARAALEAKDSAIQLREQVQAQTQICKDQAEQARSLVEENKAQIIRTKKEAGDAAQRASQYANTAREATSRVQKMVSQAKQLSTPADGSVTTDKLAPDLVLIGTPNASTPDADDKSTRIATTAFTQMAILRMFDEPKYKSLSDDDYQKLPGGFIIQWGETITWEGGNSEITFPTPFLNRCMCIHGMHMGGECVIVSEFSKSRSRTGTRLCAFDKNGERRAGWEIQWFALGY